MSVKLFCDRCGQECKKHWELRVHTDASCLRPDFTRVLCKSCAADIMSLVNPGTDASVAVTGQKAMDREHLIAALKMMQVETGSLVCLGCGHEHNCGVHGCAIIREAVAQLEAMGAVCRPSWISVEDRVPVDERPVLAFVGYADTMIGFMTVSSYFCFDPTPHWQWDGLVRDDQRTLFWMPLPEPPSRKAGEGMSV